MASTTAASLHNILSATSPTSPRLDVLWQQQKQTPVESQSKLQLQNHYPMRLVVLLIGGGGREHALCYALQQSPSCDAVFCAAGNVGISNSGNGTCIPDLDIFDSSAVISFCHKWGVGLVVVGTEAPLVAGLANDLVKNAPSFDKNVTSSTIKQRQQHEASGRIIRNILLNKDSRQNQSSRVQSEQQIKSSNLEKEKRLQRPPRGQLVLKDVNGSSDDKFVGNDLHGFSGEKQEKLTRNKDGLLFVGQMSHMQVTNPCLHLHLSLHK